MITHRPNTARTMMLAPAAITLTVLVGLPLIMLIVPSFTDFNARSLFTGTFEPVGFRQYAALFSSGPFYHALASQSCSPHRSSWAACSSAWAPHS